MRTLILSAAGLALVAGGVYVLRPDSVEEATIVPDGEPRRSESVVALLPDGGLGYLSPQAVLVDAGCTDDGCAVGLDTVYVVEDTAACRRKVPGLGDDCFMVFPDGGAAELPYWLRLRQEDVVGADCQPVACAVISGQNPDQDERALVEETP